MAAKIYSEYDFFAYFYNKYWTINAPAFMEQALSRLLFDKISNNAEILDVCCGTGNFAHILSERGYKVTGLDGSNAMLTFAHINAPKCEFLQADARDFSINKQFEAVTCLFDSINHLLEKDDVVKVFENIYSHLQEEGLFIFDVNSEKACENVDLSDFTVVEDDTTFISLAEYDYKKRLITYNLTAFIKEQELWKRQDHQIFERFYDINEIFEMLTKAGFVNISFIDGADLGVEEFEDRLFFSAKK